MAIAPEDTPIGTGDGAASTASVNQPALDSEVDLVLPEELVMPVGAAGGKIEKIAKNYTIDKPLVAPLGEKELEKFDGIKIPLLSDKGSEVDKWMDDVKIGEVDVSEESQSWYRNVLAGFRSSPAAGMFEDALADPNADWRNTLSFGGQNINIGRPRFNNKGRDAARMSSERLQLSIRSQLGLGAPVQVPLTGSGFYATVKPFGEDEIISLWREIIANSERLGRVTHGLIFSNNQVFASRAVVQAWLNSLVETTISDLPLENILDHLTINDLPSIYQSCASAIYPNGFPLTRSVFTEQEKLPKDEITQLIDLRKCLFMNAKMFNEAQLSHMTKRIGQQMTLKSVKDYRDAFVFNHTTVVEITPEIKLHLHTPSLREYFESGEKWIEEINAIVGAALKSDANEVTRGNYVSQLAKASRLRQYAHYVKSVEESGEMYSTRENVDRVLKEMSASDEVSRKFYKAVSDYINGTQVAIVATTSVNEYEDTLSGEKWPRLIPIDALSTFFQLVEQKLRGITSRALEDT